MNTINTIHFFCFALFSSISIANTSKCPAELHKAANLIEAQLPRISNAFRVKVFCASKSSSINPQPKPDYFESISCFVITINPGCYNEQIVNSLDALKQASWTPAPSGLKGDARWCFRVIGNWNATLIDIYIDINRNWIYYDTQWYQVDHGVIDMITTKLTALGART